MILFHKAVKFFHSFLIKDYFCRMANLILHIDTATPVCSVALSRDGILIADCKAESDNMHASSLTLLIEDLMAKSGLNLSGLSAIAVSKGPGSYTGLRIGVSTAKGLAYALDVPVIGIDALQSMAAGFIQLNGSKLASNVLLAPMIDARRMEVYMAVYNSALELLTETQAVIMDAQTFDFLPADYFVKLFGTGANKLQLLYEPNARVEIVPNFVSRASYMCELAYKRFQQQDFESLAYFEPFYLKDFIPTTPKKLL